MFGPTSGDDQRGRPLLPRQRHLRQARSLIAYQHVCLFVRLSVCPSRYLSSGVRLAVIASAMLIGSDTSLRCRLSKTC